MEEQTPNTQQDAAEQPAVLTEPVDLDTPIKRGKSTVTKVTAVSYTHLTLPTTPYV